MKARGSLCCNAKANASLDRLQHHARLGETCHQIAKEQQIIGR